MKLLAISGGPDSMYLLNKYKKKDIMVAHVNYNKRKDSNIDENIVKNFCKKHNIKLESLIVQKIPEGNFQDEARKIRYEFFSKVYTKNNCNMLLLAHHKDDFIETAIMQQKSNRMPKQFGMLQKNIIYNMNIYRPFLFSLYKNQITKYLDKHKINFAIDSSNSELIYERNVVRHDIKTKSLKEKESIFNWFIMSNKILKKKHKRIDKVYNIWFKSSFALNAFRSLDRDKEQLVYRYMHEIYGDIKLSSSKINSLISFIEGEKGNVIFKLNNFIGVKKKNGKLIKIQLKA